MYKFLKFLFYKDWILVDSYCGTFLNDKKENTGYVYYNIYYSKYLNKYKLELEGKCSKEHPQYFTAKLRLVELNNTL